MAFVGDMDSLDRIERTIRGRGATLLFSAAVTLTALWLFFFSIPAISAVANGGPSAERQFVDNEMCLDCHGAQAEGWRVSDHAQAMQEANAQTVLGDFNDATFTDAGVTSRFFRKDGLYFINTQGEDGQYQDFEVKYTFGIRPLQQYLLSLPKGRLQAFTVAWDSVKKQWFDLYPGVKFAPGSPMHWSGRAFTANSSCMECHMTNVALNYDVKTARYETTWREVNVSCQSCHGPGGRHVSWAQDKRENKTGYVNKGLVVDYAGLDSHGRVESCARCHSRRYAVSKNDSHGRSFFDDFMPELLREGMYHSDGQILDEVYVYGSFAQSKMYRQGVDCMDCHNPHTLKLRIAGNGLCVRCHRENPDKERFPSLASKNYNAASHHFHQPDSEGAQCVNCHMPETAYMQVDPRRDHSFSIPRPDHSKAWSVPNGCTRCHSGKQPEWAITAMDRWYGKKWRQRPSIAATMSQARAGKAEAAPALAGLIKSPGQTAVVRATALDLLARYGPAGLNVALDALSDPSPLVRSTALRGLDQLPQKHKFKELLALLNDPVQGVRIEAARVLAAVPRGLLDAEALERLDSGLKEYQEAQMALNDYPEGHLNMGNLYVRMGKADLAEQAYRSSIAVDPYFPPAYNGLARLYYATGRKKQALETFLNGLKLAPDAGDLHYAAGLLLAEENRLEEAAAHLQKAAELLPGQAQVHFNYGLLLQRLGNRSGSEKALVRAYQLSPHDKKFQTALAAHYRQTGQTEKAEKLLPNRLSGVKH